MQESNMSVQPGISEKMAMEVEQSKVFKQFVTIIVADGSMQVHYTVPSQKTQLCISELSELVECASQNRQSLVLDLSQLHPLPPKSRTPFIRFIISLS